MLPHCLGFFYAGFALVAKCFQVSDYDKKKDGHCDVTVLFIVIICMVLHVLVYLVVCAV